MTDLRKFGLGMALTLVVLTSARGQQPEGPFTLTGRLTGTVTTPTPTAGQTGPNLEWLFFSAEADSSSGLSLAAVDDAARAHLNLPRGQGLLVVALAPNSPAGQAGVAQNDIFLTLEDMPLAKPEDLEAGLRSAGDKPLALGLLHQGQKKTIKVQPLIKVTFGPVPKAASSFWIGVQVAAVEPALRAHLSLPADRGLIATEVIADGPAAKAGLKVNDILLSIDGSALLDQAQLSEHVQKQGEKPASLEIIREGKKQTIEVTPQKRTVAPKTALVNYYRNLNFVRPGVVVQGQPATQDLFTVQPRMRYSAKLDTLTTENATDKRLDALDAELKSLRKAVEDLSTALKKQQQ